MVETSETVISVLSQPVFVLMVFALNTAYHCFVVLELEQMLRRLVIWYILNQTYTWSQGARPSSSYDEQSLNHSYNPLEASCMAWHVSTQLATLYLFLISTHAELLLSPANKVCYLSLMCSLQHSLVGCSCMFPVLQHPMADCRT